VFGLLICIVATECVNFAQDVEEDAFRTFRARKSVVGRATGVAAGNITATVCGEGNAVGELLAPAYVNVSTGDL